MKGIEVADLSAKGAKNVGVINLPSTFHSVIWSPHNGAFVKSKMKYTLHSRIAVLKWQGSGCLKKTTFVINSEQILS